MDFERLRFIETAARAALAGASIVARISVNTTTWQAQARYANPTDRPAGDALLATLPAYTARRRRQVAAILADVDAALDTAAKDKAALHRLLAVLAMKEPKLLRRLNLAIDGDEPEV